MIDPELIAEFITEDIHIFNEKAMEIDPKELEMGIETEYEHTTDPKMAKKIAMDHLREDPHYYSKLKNCMPGEVK